jgi:hypothetical protein
MENKAKLNLVFNNYGAIMYDHMVEILLTALLSICGFIMIYLSNKQGSYEKEMTKLRQDVSSANNDIKSNYLERFDKVHNTLETNFKEVNETLNKVLIQISSQQSYCEAMQVSKTQTKGE